MNILHFLIQFNKGKLIYFTELTFSRDESLWIKYALDLVLNFIIKFLVFRRRLHALLLLMMRDFILSLLDENRDDVIGSFKSTSRYQF